MVHWNKDFNFHKTQHREKQRKQSADRPCYESFYTEVNTEKIISYEKNTGCSRDDFALRNAKNFRNGTKV